MGAWAPQRNCTETLRLLERDAAPIPSCPGRRTLATRSTYPGLAPFFPHPAIALASRRPQRGHRGPPVPREMFQAFPGDYDSGSRCSSSPSAESQYLSSVDSFGSPPTAAASQVSSNGLGYCFVGFNFFQVKGGTSTLPTPRKDSSNPRISDGIGAQGALCKLQSRDLFAIGRVRGAQGGNAEG